MKLLHVITSLEIGGAQRLLSDLIPLQINQGLDVSIVVNASVKNSFSENIELSGANIINLKEPDFYSPKNIFKLRKIFKDFDLIHVHLFPSLYWAAIANLGIDSKLIYTEHSTSNNRRTKRYIRAIERFIYRRYNKIISISNQTQDNLKSWLNESDDRFIVINNGVDVNKFCSVNRKSLSKSLIMISRFVAAKDHETVIRAMKYVKKDIKLRFVGDGENLENCKNVASKEDVCNRIEFLGQRSDIAELISESYIGIQSSNWEGFGLTAIEIMAAGKPVVASDVDGLKQVVEGAGLIFKKGDHIDLANCINRLLEDEDLYRSTSEKCMERAARYDISKMAAEYSNVYKAVMA